MKTLSGQDLEHTDYARLLADVDRLLWELVYKPIVDLVRPTLPKQIRSELAPADMLRATPEELRNAADAEGAAALKKALKDGLVQMVPDHTGKTAMFAVVKPDRRISDGLKAFGAVLNKTTGYWTCEPQQVPSWVRAEAQSYAARSQAVHDDVKKLTDEIAKKIDRAVDEFNLSKAADHAINEVEHGWKASAKGLEIMPDLGPAGQAALVAGFERSRAINIKSPGTKVGMVTVLEESTKREVKVWAQEALARLRAEVDENAQQGYRSSGLTERIRNEYGVSKGRADLIARQETNNFMANYRGARAADAGLKRYQWFCSRDSRTRKDHLALHGHIFYYSQPPITDTRTGARNNPGQDFRCLPGDSKIELAGNVVEAYRRWYSGDLTALITAEGEAIRATPNHPVLTVGGWKAADAIKRGDYLIGLRADLLRAPEGDVHHGIPSIEEIFDSLTKTGTLRRVAGRVEQFHGDGTERDVDVVRAARPLRFWLETSARKSLEDLLLPIAEESTLRQSLADLGSTMGVGSVRGAGLGGQGTAVLERQAIHSQDVRLGAGTRTDASGQQPDPHGHAFKTETTRDGELALAGDIGRYCRPVLVREVRRFDFTGHVFNLETEGGWYASGGIVTHNCRCVDRPVLE